MIRCLILGALLSTSILVIASACGSAQLHTNTVAIADVRFDVDIATTRSERAQGLSNREILPIGSGMLLAYGPGEAPGVWMRDMLFPLDVVWIGSNCRVLGTIVNVSTPDQGTADADLTRYIPAIPTTYVLEINAGEVVRLGIQPDDVVQFSGFEVSGAGC